MTIKNIAIRLLAALMLCSTFAVAHNFHTDPAPQKDAPAQVVKVLANAQDLGYQVDIKNVSKDKIREVQIGWVIEFPPSCGSAAVVPLIDSGRLEEITIAPGETKSTFYQRINVSELVARHVKNKINVSHVQVGVIRVKFQSGKEWSFDLAAVGSFDDHQQTNSMECPADCADGQTTQTTALPKETLRAKAESNSPDTGHICLYRCIGTASYTYCVIVNNPAPGCTKDSLGHCCSAPTCTPELCPPYGTCYLQCDGS